MQILWMRHDREFFRSGEINQVGADGVLTGAGSQGIGFEEHACAAEDEVAHDGIGEKHANHIGEYFPAAWAVDTDVETFG